MPIVSIKQRIVQHLPDKQVLNKHVLLRGLSALVKQQPRLWQCNRHSIAVACFIGLFVAMIPLPLQMLIAASWAVVLQGNLPLSVSLVWVSNPITMPPLFYFSYQLGASLLTIEKVELTSASLAWENIANHFLSIWLPLLTGSLLIGALLGLSGYYLVNWLWRRDVIQRWQLRKQRLAASTNK